jgi:GT2 family glycosyltransferase
MISIVILTYNRLHLLRQCVDKALLRTSEDTQEILIWNNASTDGTREYLDGLSDPRFRVIHHDKNIGQNAYAFAMPMTTQPYFIEMDDDIVEAPQHWDRAMLRAFEALPQVGFLQARLADDGYSPGSDLFYRINNNLYTLEEVNGIRIYTGGPVGGMCTMSSRELHDRVGGFRQDKKHVFWHEDAAYVEDIQKLGFRKAVLDEVVVVHHAGGHYSEIIPEKRSYYEDRDRVDARKAAVKRLLYKVPLVPPLNARFGFFEPPKAA